MFCFSLTVYCSHYLCATGQTYTKFTTITICSLLLSAYNLVASHTCNLLCTQLRCSNTQLHTRLIELQLTHMSALLCPFISQQGKSNERSRELYRNQLLFLRSHTYLHVCSPWFKCSKYLLV